MNEAILILKKDAERLGSIIRKLVQSEEISSDELEFMGNLANEILGKMEE